jgi:hypothetical protein
MMVATAVPERPRTFGSGPTRIRMAASGAGAEDASFVSGYEHLKDCQLRSQPLPLCH